MMNIILFSNSDHHGGASLTALNLASSLNQYFPDDFSGLYVSRKRSSFSFVHSLALTKFVIFSYLRNALAQFILRFMFYSNPHVQSLAFLPSTFKLVVNKYKNPVIHLHWINGEFISISDLVGINAPIIWTLHDCWPFLGTEHHDFSSTTDRYYSGSPSLHPPSQLKGLDLSLYTWLRKRRIYRLLDLHIICPSNWMKLKARKSLLFQELPIHVIPNSIDTDVFSLSNQQSARSSLNIVASKNIVMFCCYGNDSFDLKGSSYILPIIKMLLSVDPSLHFLIVGNISFTLPFDSDSITLFGKITDARIMAKCYQSSNLFINLSKFENLPTVCIEAQSCGIPVFAFDVGGTVDTIVDDSTGYLATPFDLNELVSAVSSYLLYNTINGKSFSPHFCRDEAVRRFSLSSVARQHHLIYNSVRSSG